MIDAPILPKDDKDMCRVIDHHVMQMRTRRNFRHAMWHLASAYLSGHRVFELRDRHNFRIEARYLDREGKMQVQVNQLLDLINKVSGLLESIDLRPETVADGTTIYYRDGQVERITDIGGEILKGMLDETTARITDKFGNNNRSSVNLC